MQDLNIPIMAFSFWVEISIRRHAAELILAVQFLEEYKIDTLRAEYVKIPIVSGFLYEIYFNSKGEFRRPDFKVSFIDQAFALLTRTQYLKSLSFINQVLQSYSDKLILLPSADLQPVKFEVALKTEEFEEGIFIRNIENNEDRWSGSANEK